MFLFCCFHRKNFKFISQVHVLFFFIFGVFVDEKQNPEIHCFLNFYSLSIVENKLFYFFPFASSYALTLLTSLNINIVRRLWPLTVPLILATYLPTYMEINIFHSKETFEPTNSCCLENIYLDKNFISHFALS